MAGPDVDCGLDKYGDAYGYGFDGPKPTPAKPEALAFADAVLRLLKAADAREKAENEVPNYTAQWSPSDYTANADETFNRAADKLFNLITKVPDGRP